MDALTKYKLTTGIYALCFLFGVVMSIISLLQEKWIVFLIALAFAYVGLDNTFCGTHAKVCGYHVKTHYVIPPFLQGKRPKK